MFGSKSLLSCKRAGSICLYFATKSNKTKEISVLGVVNYNKENKHLFGELLETRAQRRRTLKKEQGAGLKGENDHPNKSCEKNLEGFATKSASKTSVKRKCKSLNKILEQVDTLNGDCGEFLEKAANKSAVKTSRKQKSKSNSFINIVNNKSSTSVTNSRDVCDEKLLGTESKYIKKSECDQIVFTEKEKANDDPINGEHLIVNVVNKSNLNGSGDNIIQQVGDLPYVDSNLFPLINLKKCHLKYDDCVKPVINISYESVCKNVLSGLPSVGKILSETMPEAARAALERWKKNMIAQLGEQGFQKLNKENLGRGALFHEYVRRYLVGEASDDDLPEKVHYYFKSLAAVFPRISDVKVVESHVAHPQLQYCGFIDCVAKYDGTPVVIEWKLAEKPKHDIRSTYDAPLQMSAYLGALNYDENYNFPVASGVVVAAYTDGSPANVFYLPEEKCLKYWEGFQNRLQEYKKLKSV